MSGTLEVVLPDAAAPVRVHELTHELAKKSAKGAPKSLRESLRGAKFVFPSPARDAAPTPSMVRRRAMLERRAADREYAALVSSVYKPPVRPEERVGASLRHQFTIGANMIVAPIAIFFVAYILSKSVVEKQSTRVTVGLLSGVAMLFIEMILHISRSYLVEKNTERKKKRRA